MADWKHRKAEEEVEALLGLVSRDDAALLEVFPRPIEDLVTGVFAVAFESCSNLCGRLIVEILEERYRIDHRELLDDGNIPLAGYTFARGDFAVIFAESGFGEDFERFTKAHEIGHLVIEYWPRLASSKQPTLFGGEPGPALYARRDPLGHIFIADSAEKPEEMTPDDYRKLRADHQAWLREAKANGFAAELLAPHREIRRLAAGLPPGSGRIDVVRARFGLSRRAAEIRLTELGLLVGPNPTQPLFSSRQHLG